MAAYAEKLKDPRWQKRRLEILDRDNWTCQHCGDTTTSLHVHHLIYNGANPWETPGEKMITLCEHCHAIVDTYELFFSNTSMLKIKKILSPKNKANFILCFLFEDFIGKGITFISRTDAGYDLFPFIRQDQIAELKEFFSEI